MRTFRLTEGKENIRHQCLTQKKGNCRHKTCSNTFILGITHTLCDSFTWYIHAFLMHKVFCLLLLGVPLRNGGDVLDTLDVGSDLGVLVKRVGRDVVNEPTLELAEVGEEKAVRNGGLVPEKELLGADLRGEMLHVGGECLLQEALTQGLHDRLSGIRLGEVLGVSEDGGPHTDHQARCPCPVEVLNEPKHLLCLKHGLRVRGVQLATTVVASDVAQHGTALHNGVLTNLHHRELSVLRRRLQGRPVLEFHAVILEARLSEGEGQTDRLGSTLNVEVGELDGHFGVVFFVLNCVRVRRRRREREGSWGMF